MTHSHDLVPFQSQEIRHSPLHPNEMVRVPWLARLCVRLLLALFVTLPFALLYVPWQQTVRGRGQIVAFSPTERQQVVTTRISGQIRKWHVVEGSRVKVGDPIVDIDDNDPDRDKRLSNQREILKERLKASLEQRDELERVVEAEEKALVADVKAAEAKREAMKTEISIAERLLEIAKFAVGFEERRLQMNQNLFRQQLESEINRDQSQVSFDRAKVEVMRSDLGIDKARAGVTEAEAAVLKAVAGGASKVADARSKLRSAEQNVFTVRRDIEELDSQIARFSARFVKAPTSGIVFRILTNVGEGGQFIKEGDELALIVPDSDARVVEIFVNGVDAPLIAAHMQAKGEGPHVRLQFEGWPAVQFAGWPSVAIGTFGGKILQMDPTDDGKGRFRVLVEPDQLFEGDEWPEPQYIRQGNQSIGWVFLNRVTLGFELWRQFNGFPPVIAPQAPEADKDDRKPPKVKVG